MLLKVALNTITLTLPVNLDFKKTGIKYVVCEIFATGSNYYHIFMWIKEIFFAILLTF